jgi:hypothetical protein
LCCAVLVEHQPLHAPAQAAAMGGIHDWVCVGGRGDVATLGEHMWARAGSKWRREGSIHTWVCQGRLCAAVQEVEVGGR